MDTQTLDYEALMQTTRGDVVSSPSADQLPARRPAGTVAAPAGFGADLAAMAGPLLSMGLTRPPMTELLAEARRIGMQMGARAYYSFPAGGAKVEGGSIRLAEELAQAWGFLTTAVQIQDIRDGRVYLRGIAGDALTMRAHAEDRVYALSAPSGGFAKNAEQADRWQTMQIASGGSKALRSAIFRLIPARMVHEAVQAAKEAKQPPEKVDFNQLCDALVMMFAKSKAAITLAELEEAVGTKRLQWRIPEWRTLDDLMEALRHGETTPEEVWPARAKGGVRAPAPLPSAGSAAPAAPPPLPAVTPTPTPTQRTPPSGAALAGLERAHPEAAEHARQHLRVSEAADPKDIDPDTRLALAQAIETQLPPDERRWS